MISHRHVHTTDYSWCGRKKTQQKQSWNIGVNIQPSHPEGVGLIPTIARYFCPSARHFIHIAALDPGV